jgi:hypothetical protein
MLGFMGKISARWVMEFLNYKKDPHKSNKTFNIICTNLLYLLENVYLLMMHNWTTPKERATSSDLRPSHLKV